MNEANFNMLDKLFAALVTSMVLIAAVTLSSGVMSSNNTNLAEADVNSTSVRPCFDHRAFSTSIERPDLQMIRPLLFWRADFVRAA